MKRASLYSTCFFDNKLYMSVSNMFELTISTDSLNNMKRELNKAMPLHKIAYKYFYIVQ